MIKVKYTHKESNIKSESDFKDQAELEQHLVGHPEMYDSEIYEVTVGEDDSAARLQNESNEAALKYLSETDWYVIRKSETNVAIPEEVLTQRQVSRDAIVK